MRHNKLYTFFAENPDIEKLDMRYRIPSHFDVRSKNKQGEPCLYKYEAFRILDEVSFIGRLDDIAMNWAENFDDWDELIPKMEDAMKDKGRTVVINLGDRADGHVCFELDGTLRAEFTNYDLCAPVQCYASLKDAMSDELMRYVLVDLLECVTLSEGQETALARPRTLTEKDPDDMVVMKNLIDVFSETMNDINRGMTIYSHYGEDDLLEAAEHYRDELRKERNRLNMLYSSMICDKIADKW